ncbi:MAG: hypothetical protein D6797_00435 [Bdellovibrio sp.]|nr:MAG: hypothetical protein D6797_00435 [Bdellovibrio sp.]
MIVYGSSNGPQTNRQTGVTTYTDPNEVTAKPPCDVNNNCKVQLLASSTGTAAAFGFSVVGMPSLEGGSSEDELLISDPQFNSNDGEVYFYKGASTGIPSTKTQTLVPIPNTHTNYTGPHQFGYNMASVGDLNNDGINDVAITAPAKNGSDPGFLYIFYGGPIGGNSAQLGIYGVANYSATEDWKRDNGNGGLEDILLNWQHRDASDPHPQIIRPSGILNSDYFGYGVSAAGDFNNDGYNDVLVNVAAGDFNISGNLTETGFAIMYFGGPNGLQSDSTINIAPDCYGSGSSAICKPYQIYLPDRENYEHLYVSPFASGDFNGDGLPDIILGGRGRSHPSGQAYSTGVLYVIY